MRIAWLGVALVACTAPNPESPTPAAASGDPACPIGLEIGDCAPDFQLLNADGTPVRLHDRVGDRLVVVGASMW